MTALRRFNRLWLAGAAAALSVIIAQAAVEALTVKGDAAAWAEVVAALKKQHSVSYRGKFTTGATGIVEFAPPASEHAQFTSLGFGVEYIRVGNTRWLRPQGKWDCASPVKVDPVPDWDKEGEVTATRIPGLVIGGMQTRGYAYTLTFAPDPATGVTLIMPSKLYVGVQTGLPLRLITEAKKKDEQTVAIDYYDYGAPVTIKPPC